jgi:dipeptidyl aminopeptidase/acylaminoacyl peptidase
VTTPSDFPFQRRRVFISASVLLLGVLLFLRIAGKSCSYAWLEFDRGPAAEISRHPERAGIKGLAEISFQTKDGVRIAGWYAPSKNRAAVVVVHGTNADRSSMLAETRILADGRFGVLAFDWPGSGASGGKVHWGEGERQALTAALGWLGSRGDVDPHRIGGLGFSMGGYMMAQVAARDTRLHSVVLEATPPAFGEYSDWAHRHGGLLSEMPALWTARWEGMPVDEMQPRNVVAAIAPRPLLVIGGDADTVVPQFMTRELFDSAREPKTLWIVHGAAHGRYAEAAPQDYATRLLAFFARTLSG